MKHASKLIALLLTIALLCGSGVQALAEAPKPEKLTVLIWGDMQSKETYDQIINEQFTAVHGIPVETILVPQTDFYEKLTIMIATDTPPDATWIPDASFPKYMNEGLLADLSDLAQDEEFDYDGFVEAQRTSYTVDGAPYAMPFSSPPLVLFYNRTVVEAAGLLTPNELYERGEWTTDKLVECAIALSDPQNGLYGINYTRAADWGAWGTPLYPVIWSYGGEFWSKDGSEWLLNSEAAVKGLAMFGDLMFKYNAHPKPGDSADFFAGQCVFYPSLFGDCRKMVNLEFEWDCAPMPFDDNGQYTGWLGTAAVGVLESAKNKDWAKELVKVLTGHAMMTALQDVFIPPRTSVLSSEEFVTGHNGVIPRPSLTHYNQSVIDPAGVIRTKDVHLNIEQIDDVITSNIEAFYMQAVTAQECLQLIADEVQPFLVK